MLLPRSPHFISMSISRAVISSFLLLAVSFYFYAHYTSNVNSVTTPSSIFYPEDPIGSRASQLNGHPDDGQQQPCPLVSPQLVGWTNLSSETMAAILQEDPATVESQMKAAGIQIGGRYRPKECRSPHKVAIVVPVRDRKDHLTVFLRYMHPFLQRKQLDYIVIVVEQSDGLPFNRGMLMNVGFKESQLFNETFDCLILHDVDMLPEHDGNPYTCPEVGKPRQMAFALDYFKNYSSVGEGFFGAVTAISAADFGRINGFANSFWGWGGEDENFYHRVVSQNLKVFRPFDGQSSVVVHYKMQSHKRAVPSPNRLDVMKEGFHRFKTDGLNSLRYKIIDYQSKLLYTHILVDFQRDNFTLGS